MSAPADQNVTSTESQPPQNDAVADAKSQNDALPTAGTKREAEHESEAAELPSKRPKVETKVTETITVQQQGQNPLANVAPAPAVSEVNPNGTTAQPSVSALPENQFAGPQPNVATAEGASTSQSIQYVDPQLLNLYVCHIPEEYEEHNLQVLFAAFGTITR